MQVIVALSSGVILLYAGKEISKKVHFSAPHNIRTGSLGIQFFQNNAPSPIVYKSDHYEVILNKSPFEIRIDKDVVGNNPSDIGLCIAIYDSDKIWHCAKEEWCFSCGLAGADRAYGSGDLSLSDFAGETAFSYNYIGETRFNANTDRQFGAYVSAITEQPLTSKNLMQKGRKLYCLIACRYKKDGRLVLNNEFEKLIFVFK